MSLIEKAIGRRDISDNNEKSICQKHATILRYALAQLISRINQFLHEIKSIRPLESSGDESAMK
jgi:hypothetical protein